MNFTRAVAAVRDVDKQWQRRRFPDRRRVLVNSRTAMNYATLAPMVERLGADPRVRFSFASSEDPSLATRIYADAGESFCPITPLQSVFSRFDVYLAADFLWMTLPRGARRVQTFHGVAGKYRRIYDSPSHSMQGWDRLFFINRRRLEHFTRCGALDANPDAARLIGMPKLDCLVDGSLVREDILLTLGIDPARPTVLYAPTWSAHSSLVSMGVDLVTRLGQAGYAVIVKLHDRSRDSRHVNSGGVDWGARLEPLLKGCGGVLATGSNSSRYLPAADVMITDHSSVGFEYLLLDRPLIRIHVPELIANTDIEPSYVDLLASAASNVQDVPQAVASVARCLADPRHQSGERVAVAEEMFYQPGTATARAVKELYQVMELDPP